MSDNIYFYPVNARLNNKGAICRIPEEVKDTEPTIKYFFNNLMKHPELKEQDIFYFICLNECVVLFKTTPELDLTGMIFKSDMIIKAWNSLIILINYLSNVMYKDIADQNCISVNDIQLNIHPDYDMLDSIKKELRNTYIPHSFITCRFPASFYGVESGNVSFPQVQINQCQLNKNTQVQKKCIPYNENIKKCDKKNKAVIGCVLPVSSEKNIFRMIKDKIQKHDNFADNLILKCDDESVFLNTLSQVYHIYDEPDSNLFDLSKIAEHIKK